MTTDATIENEVKQFIISTLKLEDITPSDLEPDAPLFGGGGVGLDSVDALELGVALHKVYGIKIDSKSEESRANLGSVRALAALLHKHRSAA